MMPATEEILALLERISNELMIVTGIVHILILGFIIALATGWRLIKKITVQTQFLNYPFQILSFLQQRLLSVRFCRR